MGLFRNALSSKGEHGVAANFLKFCVTLSPFAAPYIVREHHRSMKKESHEDTERKEGKITNYTNQRIAQMIREIRSFVKFVINLFFSVPTRFDFIIS